MRRLCLCCLVLSHCVSFVLPLSHSCAFVLGISRARAKAKGKAVAKVALRAVEAGLAVAPGAVAKGKEGLCTTKSVQMDCVLVAGCELELIESYERLTTTQASL